MEKSKTKIEKFLSFPNYLEISDDECEFENFQNEKFRGKVEKSEKLSRSREKSFDNINRHKSDKEDRHKHSKDKKYKRYDKCRSSSNSSSSYLRETHKKRKYKFNINSSKSDTRPKRKNLKSSSSSSLSSSELESESNSASKSDNKSSKYIHTETSIGKENEINSKPNLFEEKKSKWSTVEEDELKEKEKAHIIQVNLLLNKNDSSTKKESEKMTNIEINSDQKEKVTLQRYRPPANSINSNKHWKLFTFKDKIKKDIHKIDSKSYYLIGKEEKTNDIVINHPSCSRQHAAIQFLKNEKDNGIKINIIDLKSTNGTFVNKTKLEPERYHELKEYDVINFGNSTRDYIVMIEN